MENVVVVIGAGQNRASAIARRDGVGKAIGNAGYAVSVATVDVSPRKAVHGP